MFSAPVLNQPPPTIPTIPTIPSMAAFDSTIPTGLLLLHKEAMDEVNSPHGALYLVTSLVGFLFSLAANIGAVLVIKKKEKTRINNMIMCDCIANIMSVGFIVIWQKSVMTTNLAPVCLVEIFLRNAFSVWNRLVPVGQRCKTILLSLFKMGTLSFI